MPKAEQTSWVFANVKGRITRAISQLRKINNVESVTPVTGRFDLVIKLRTNEPNKTFNIVEKIRKIKGIASTQTGISLQKISNATLRPLFSLIRLLEVPRDLDVSGLRQSL